MTLFLRFESSHKQPKQQDDGFYSAPRLYINYTDGHFPMPRKEKRVPQRGTVLSSTGVLKFLQITNVHLLTPSPPTIIFCHEEIQVYTAQSVGVVMSIPYSSTSFLSTWYSPAPVHIHTTHTIFFPVLKANQRTEQDRASPSTTHKFVRTSPFVLEVHQMLWQPLFLSTHFYN